MEIGIAIAAYVLRSKVRFDTIQSRWFVAVLFPQIKGKTCIVSCLFIQLTNLVDDGLKEAIKNYSQPEVQKEVDNIQEQVCPAHGHH